MKQSFTEFRLFETNGDGACTCNGTNCPGPGKHPREAYGKIQAGRSVSDTSSVGRRTGSSDGYFVVDIDRKNGVDGLANLSEIGDLPPTYTVSTPSGGLHLYFKHPNFKVHNSQSKLCKGVDIRGHNGFVVAPGSRGANGLFYEVVQDGPISQAPEWLLHWLMGSSSSDSYSEPLGDVPECEIPEVYRVSSAKRWLEDQEISVQGSAGHATAIRVITTATRAFFLTDIDLVIQALQDWNQRCQPPWSEQELRHKAREAITKGRQPWGVVVSTLEEADRVLGKLKRVDPPTPDMDQFEPVPIAPRKKKSTTHQYSLDIGAMPTTDKPGAVDIATAINMLLTSEDWAGVLQLDEFRNEISAVDPPIRMDAEKGEFSEQDITAVQVWFLVRRGRSIQKEHVIQAVQAVAKRNKFHPVRQWLNDLPTGNPDDLKGLAKLWFGDESDISQVCLEKFLVGAVRRVLDPGCEMQTMLVLYGGQGAGKSPFVRKLFGREWTRSEMPDLGSRDASHALVGYWAIELDELDRVLRTENETVKSFLSRPIDNFRPPYGRRDIRFERQSVFIGTTNKGDFLRDATGAKRFWPVRLPDAWGIPLEKVEALRDKVWAAALVLAEDETYEHFIRRGTPMWEALTSHQSIHEEEDSWADSVAEYLVGKSTVRGTKDVLMKAIYDNEPGSLSRITRRETTRLRDILLRLGCKYMTLRDGEEVYRGWKVPKELSDMKRETKRTPLIAFAGGK